MLAKAVDRLPDVPLQYEPKWDGFRCMVFRDGDDLALTSRNSRPFNRYSARSSNGSPAAV
jgi:ATP-dependent DNA ligase